MANRDESQKIGFLYSNVYQIYKDIQTQSPSQSKKVWNAQDLENLGLKITKFTPPNLKKTKPVTPAQNPAVEDLKSNLNRLQDLHSRLRFMLKELEDLVGKKKN